MSVTNWRRTLAAVIVTCTFACTRNPAPNSWLPTATSAGSDPYGAWVVVSLEGPNDRSVAGEFLAVDDDSVFVLTPDSVVRSVALDSVTSARLAFYDAEWSRLAMWTAAGALSTVSNGYFLVFTLPAWAIGGTLGTAAESRAPILSIDDRAAWYGVRKYARFPAGLPTDLPRTLTPRTSR